MNNTTGTGLASFSGTARSLYQKGQWQNREQVCRVRLSSHPEDAEAHALLGHSQLQRGQLIVAMVSLCKARRLGSFQAETEKALTRVFQGLFQKIKYKAFAGDHGEVCWPGWVQVAQRTITSAAAAHPDDFPLNHSAALVEKYLGHHESALAFVRRGLLLQPDHGGLLLVKAEVLHNLRRLDEAGRLYDRLLTLNPDHVVTRWLHGSHHLLMGNFEAGWQGYEAREAAYGLSVAAFPFPGQRWQGESLEGKTLLVHGEQGLGDEIMFSSLIPELANAAGRVVVATSKPLHELFSRSFPDVTVHLQDRSDQARQTWKNNPALPDWYEGEGIDVHCPNGSLARFLRPDLESFPKPEAYLKTDDDKVAWFRDELNQKVSGKPLLVGINWLANLATGTMGIEKSVNLGHLAPLLPLIKSRRIQLVGLHLKPYINSAQDHPELNVLDMSEHLASFDDTAALVHAVDLVISVDTAVAHLAGALGKPTWLLLKFAADWRFLVTAKTSHWYPDMQLIRQTRRGEWAPLISEVNKRLEGLTDPES